MGLGDEYYASYVQFKNGQLVRVDDKKDKVWKVIDNNYDYWSSDKSKYNLPTHQQASGGIKYTLVNKNNESEKITDVAQNRLKAHGYGILTSLGLAGGKRKTRKLKKSKRKHTRKSKKTNKKRRSTRRR